MSEHQENTPEEELENLSPEELEQLWVALSETEFLTVPIPSLFCDSITQKPYNQCLICEKSLKNKSYHVNKVLKKYAEFDLTETIAEMAICNTCALDKAFGVSKESEKVIIEFYSQINFAERIHQLYQSETKEHYETWIEQCIVTHKKRNELSEYQIIALISDDEKLVLNEELLMISGEAIEALHEKLSAETKQDMEDFIGKYFGIPPELLPEDRPKLILV